MKSCFCCLVFLSVEEGRVLWGWGKGGSSGRQKTCPLVCTAYLCTYRTVVSQNRHCLLDIAPHAIERLHHMHIYPIVIFIRYKSAKHIKWVSGPVRSCAGTIALPSDPGLVCRDASRMYHLLPVWAQPHFPRIADFVCRPPPAPPPFLSCCVEGQGNCVV